jgi:hypothetical protein
MSSTRGRIHEIPRFADCLSGALWDTSTNGPGLLPRKRDQGWSLYRVPVASRRDPARVRWATPELCSGGARRSWQSMSRCSLRAFTNEMRVPDHKLQWNPTPEKLEATASLVARLGPTKGD